MTDLYNNKCRSSDQRRYSLRGWSRWWSRSSSPLPIEAPVKVDDKPKNDVEKVSKQVNNENTGYDRF